MSAAVALGLPSGLSTWAMTLFEDGAKACDMHAKSAQAGISNGDAIHESICTASENVRGLQGFWQAQASALSEMKNTAVRMSKEEDNAQHVNMVQGSLAEISRKLTEYAYLLAELVGRLEVMNAPCLLT